MKNINSIKKNEEFQLVYRNGKSYANKYLVIYIMENHKDTLRLGISVSKKVGNSVVRHRIARLIRESYRLNKDAFGQGADIVVIARMGAKDKKFQDIESAYLHIAGLYQKSLKNS